MKKLLFILVLLVSIGIQTAQSCGRRTDVSGLPSIMVTCNVDPPNTPFGMQSTGFIQSSAVAPNGDIYLSGYFQIARRFDGTNTGVIQTLTGLNGLMKMDHATGVLSVVSTPTLLPGTFPTGVRFINGFMYANLNNTFMRQNVDGSWTTILPKKVEGLMSSNDPNIFAIVYIENQNDPIGMRLWNIQTNVLTPMGNSFRPDYNSGFTINESQTSDTVVVLFHDLNIFPMIWIKGQNELLQFDNTFATPNIGIQNPIYGYGPNPGGFHDINDVIFCPNGKIYTMASDIVMDTTVLIEWNPSTQVWDLITYLNSASAGNWNSMWYDTIENEIHLNAFKGWLDVATGTFIQADQHLSHQMSASSVRSNNNLFFGIWPNNWMMQQVDTTREPTPNTTVVSNVTQVFGAQNMIFTDTTAHDGDKAMMYEVFSGISVPIDSIDIDATNCSSYSFTHFVDIGLHEYEFTLIDPSGNESFPKTIQIQASWSTGVSDLDTDFATVSTLGKTIFIKGDVSKIEVYDLNAKVIFSSRVNSNEFTQSLDNIASGMYILKAINPKGEILVRKLLLN